MTPCTRALFASSLALRTQPLLQPTKPNSADVADHCAAFRLPRHRFASAGTKMILTFQEGVQKR
jgi:hypothetical protein